MIKLSFFRPFEHGEPAVLPLFSSREADKILEKLAAPKLLPEVVRYIETLRPREDAQYVLVNALGAGEYWGSNINGDYFPEAALIHAPDNWKGDPVFDSVIAKSWPYGYPTFYEAKPFAHHRNKEPEKGFGEVELAVWHPRMKRVELVCRVDRDKCQQFGGQGVWDKLHAGGFPDVSMGCKVPFDTCSICLDWEKYRKALESFDPKEHKHPGDAVVAVFRSTQKKTVGKDGKVKWEGRGAIRGVSITRDDYCEHAAKMMNRILPDGRKIFVFNDFPRFFDISFVFIGADKTAKTMMKIAGDSRMFFMPGAEAGEIIYAGVKDVGEKRASLEDVILKESAGEKFGEMEKELPAAQATRAVKTVTKDEPFLSTHLLDTLASRPLDEVTSTASSLGIILRPREFQRIILIQGGKKGLADELDRDGKTFPKTDEVADLPEGKGAFNPALARLLLPLLESRSSFGPMLERRVIVVVGRGEPKEKTSAPSSLSSDVLRKIGAAYNAYRRDVMNMVAHSQDTLSRSGLQDRELAKLAESPVAALFTNLSAHYIKLAFWDEVGGKEEAMIANVERGLPSKTTKTVFN